ncbi:hypothetical protein LR48_Vigan08g144000 [Vigna angularis]|uniref:Uncharacterized protein n=1 Tax=Phaseolus angularis TaxID=3914 RepID=A0A0L9V6J9_PHAAN|nr:hypothetical protein LR48_Vigan08g144000 [Vigna angularis]
MTFNNIKITILCGFVTILVLRGTIGVNLGSSDSDAVNQNLIKETNHILAEIRSDVDPSDPDDQFSMAMNEARFGFLWVYAISCKFRRRRLVEKLAFLFLSFFESLAKKKMNWTKKLARRNTISNARTLVAERTLVQAEEDGRPARQNARPAKRAEDARPAKRAEDARPSIRIGRSSS